MNKQTKRCVLYSREEVEAAIKRLAAEVARDYQGKNPVLVGILKGSFVFMADLMRSLDFPLEIEFVRLSSYGKGTNSSGRVTVVDGLRCNIEGKDVLIVEDILDSGLTISFFKEYLLKKNPLSVKVCTLLDKPSRRKVPVQVDYLGFTVPDKFIVGYGIDWDEKYRNIPEICFVEETD